jgi:hypothetical protein
MITPGISLNGKQRSGLSWRRALIGILGSRASPGSCTIARPPACSTAMSPLVAGLPLGSRSSRRPASHRSSRTGVERPISTRTATCGKSKIRRSIEASWPQTRRARRSANTDSPRLRWTLANIRRCRDSEPVGPAGAPPPQMFSSASRDYLFPRLKRKFNLFRRHCTKRCP